VDKEKPDFAPSGLLAAEANTFNGVVVKYNEPAEAKIPKTKWRLYVFKDDKQIGKLFDE
jgi:smad nuclear-interacting protein 1